MKSFSTGSVVNHVGTIIYYHLILSNMYEPQHSVLYIHALHSLANLIRGLEVKNRGHNGGSHG